MNFTNMEKIKETLDENEKLKKHNKSLQQQINNFDIDDELKN